MTLSSPCIDRPGRSVCLVGLLCLFPLLMLHSAPIPPYPTNQASSITFTSVTATSVTINWTNGNGDGRLVFVKEGAGSPTDPLSGSIYSPSSNFLVPGSQLGTSGFYCVYDGNGSTCSVTGLTGSQLYTVRIYEYNMPPLYFYNTFPATGNPNTQTTETGCPSSITVTTVADTGAGSLRKAIADVCAMGTITFDDALNGQTITIASELLIDKDLTIDASALSNGIIIDAAGASRVFGIDISGGGEVTMDNLTVQNGLVTAASGGGLLVQIPATVHLNAMRFLHCKAEYGGAICQVGTGRKVRNYGTSSPSILYLAGCEFSSDTAVSAGGAICTSDSVVVENCLFVGNSAVEGGAVYQFAGRSRYTTTRFEANTAHWGGGLYLADGWMTCITDTLLYNTCLATGGSGGGVFHHDGVLLMQNTRIVSNAADLWGGGIYVENVTAVCDIDGTTIDGNMLIDGQGAGMFVGNGTVNIIGGSEITDNQAPTLVDKGDGGGIYIAQGTVSLDDAYVMDNFAGRYAGGIYVGGASAYLTCTGDSWASVVITDNVAGSNMGGAILIDAGTAAFTNTSFNTNHSSSKGGAVALWNPAGPVVFESCEFQFNASYDGAVDNVNFGGAIFAENAQLYVYNSMFIGNSVFRSMSTNAPKGGAIYLWQGGLTMDSCQFIGNTANSTNGKGGAIFTEQGTLTISASSFIINTADRSGGAICLQTATATLYDSLCSFVQNMSHRLGGAVYMENGAMINVASTFEDNSNELTNPNAAGGAINHNNGLSITRGCTFRGNQSVTGGAFFQKFGTATIVNSLFHSNAATTYAGAIGIYDATAVLGIVNCTIADNRAGSGGGGIGNNASAGISISNSILWHNNGEGLGNAIANQNPTVPIPVTMSCLSSGPGDVLGGVVPVQCTSTNPSFVDEGLEDYRLYSSSVCIDAGDDGACSEAFDIRGTGFPRKLDGTTGGVGRIDMGAFEFLHGTDPDCINPTLGGTITANEGNCGPFTPATILSLADPTGHTGTLEYRWQLSVTSDTSGWSDIAGADADTLVPDPITQTTWYRRQARVSCMVNWENAASSNVVRKAVNTTPTASITGNAAVCRNSTPLPMITIVASGGEAPYTVVLDRSGSIDTVVTNDTITYYQITSAAGSYAYTLLSITDGNTCGQALSDSAVVVVRELPAAGIAGGSTRCQSSGPAPVFFTGLFGTAPYTFHYTVNSGPEQTITTVTGDTVSFLHDTDVSGTYAYDLLSVEDANMCSAEQLGTAVIEVVPTTVAGAITGNPVAICLGSSTGTMTVTGHTGSIIQWERKMYNAWQWDTLAVTDSVYSETPATEALWVYRALVQSSPCDAQYTDTVQVMVQVCTVSGTVRYLNTQGTGMNGIRMTLYDGPTAASPQLFTTTTSGTGAYAFPAVPLGTYCLRVQSANGVNWQTWGGVNSSDYLAILRHANGTPPLIPASPTLLRMAADVRAPQDPAVINAADAQAVRTAYLTNSPSGFDVARWMFTIDKNPGTRGSMATPANYFTDLAVTVTGPGVQTDIHGLCAGDVNGSYIPQTGFKKDDEHPYVQLVTDGVSGLLPGGSAEIPLRVVDAMEVGALSLMFPDDGPVTIIAARMEGTDDADVQVVRAGGEVRLYWSSETALHPAANDVLLWLTVQAGAGYDGSGASLTLASNSDNELGRADGGTIAQARLSAPRVTAAVETPALGVHPNPVSGSATITCTIAEEGMVHITLHDVLGREIAVIADARMARGSHVLPFSGATLAPGTYLVRLETTASGRVEVHQVRMIVTR